MCLKSLSDFARIQCHTNWNAREKKVLKKKVILESVEQWRGLGGAAKSKIFSTNYLHYHLSKLIIVVRGSEVPEGSR